MEDNFFTILPSQGQLFKLTRPLYARAYYRDYSIDLLSKSKNQITFKDWYQGLDQKVSEFIDSKRVIHLFYESSFYIEGMNELISEDDLLGIDITYKHSQSFTFEDIPNSIELLNTHKMSFKEYEEKFNQGYEELKKGNCYQFNLTSYSQYTFSSNNTPWDFIKRLWDIEGNRGAYANATFIPFFNKLFLSNSPECLFDFKDGTIVTRPIKGTIKRESDNPNEIKALWRELSSDKKSEAELFMIADLLRNDLCRIDRPNAIIEKRKAMLLVPHLIHQYSELSVKVSKDITLKNILDKMFPGGSITGAPKKRVIKLLNELEGYRRGLYCGSTILINKGTIKSSINIRSATICFNNSMLTYASGGGITLKSDAQNEYLEMSYKEKSFIDLLTP